MNEKEPSIFYEICVIFCIVVCIFVFGILGSKAGLPVIQPSEPENNSPVEMPSSPEVLA